MLKATKDDILHNLSVRGSHGQQYLASLIELKRVMKDNMKILVCCTDDIGFYRKNQFFFIVEIKETICSFPGVIKMIFDNIEFHMHKFQFKFDKESRFAKLWSQTESNMKSLESLGVKSSRECL